MARKFPARALPYAILTAIIVAAISGLIIGLSETHRNIQQQYHIQQQLIHNTQSGITLLNELGNEKGYFPPTPIDLWEQGTDTVWVEKRMWGLFELAIAKGISQYGNYKDTLTKMALLGTEFSDIYKSAIYLGQKNVPLLLCGATKINGNAYLSRQGAKRGYVSGKNYINDKLVYGEIKQSSGFPKIQQHFLDSLVPFFDKNSNTQSLLQQSHQSFNSPPIIIRENHLYIDELELKNNIVLIADSSITFSANAKIENILAFAPKIRFESGFRGQLQAFASEEIHAEAYTNFDYPSVLGILKTESLKKPPTLLISSNSSLKGLLFAENNTNVGPKIKTIVEDSTRIEGQLFINGILDMQGTVFGNTICQKFTLQTPASIYDNHLLDATFDIRELPAPFLASPAIISSPKRAILLWIEQ